MYHIFIICSPVYGHQDWIHFLAIENRLAVNMDKQVSLVEYGVLWVLALSNHIVPCLLYGWKETSAFHGVIRDASWFGGIAWGAALLPGPQATSLHHYTRPTAPAESRPSLGSQKFRFSVFFTLGRGDEGRAGNLWDAMGRKTFLGLLW